MLPPDSPRTGDWDAKRSLLSISGNPAHFRSAFVASHDFGMLAANRKNRESAESSRRQGAELLSQCDFADTSFGDWPLFWHAVLIGLAFRETRP
jgi:hypothetical protein